jgi:hypothetical protein
MNKQQQKALIEAILKAVEIAPSTYESAVKRYKAMTDWFGRPESKLRDFDPLMYTQGSFRLGTVIRPIFDGEEYDLDLVLRLSLSRYLLTQKELKDLVGEEVKSYAKAQNFKKEPTSGKRCWTQEYQESGNTGFHMDILPAIPDDEKNSLREQLEKSGTDSNIAEHAIAITDSEDPAYGIKSFDWPVSNSKGFAMWFEERANRSGLVKEARDRMLSKSAEVEDVPLYRLKTPLQQVIQILKRHRDVKFRGNPDDKPASIIISTLAARAYRGESDVTQALETILADMGSYVQTTSPRIENPAKAGEDFSDRWDTAGHSENSFWNWLREAQRDLTHLGTMDKSASVRNLLEEKFDVRVSNAQLPESLLSKSASIIAPTILAQGPASWGNKVDE